MLHNILCVGLIKLDEMSFLYTEMEVLFC
jgi:hypothetical protein